MSRVLISITVSLLLLVLGALVILRVEGFWNEQRALKPAISDWLFYQDWKNTGSLDQKEPVMNQRNYIDTRARLLSPKQNVRDLAIERLKSWSPAVIPWLMKDLQDPPDSRYINGLATVLAELEYVHAEPVLIQHLYGFHNQKAVLDGLFQAIGILGLKTSKGELIEWQASQLDEQGRQPPVTREYLIALAKTGGKEYLLQQFKAAQNTDEIVLLIEPLAYTFDPEIVSLLMGLSEDHRQPVASAATAALDDIVAPMAISALTDQFIYNENPFIRLNIIDHYFDDNDINHDDRILPLLKDLLNDPLFKNNAVQALLNIDTPESISALAPIVSWDNLDRLFIDLDYYQRKNQKIILLQLLGHSNPEIRIQALDQLWFNPDHDVTKKLNQAKKDEIAEVRDKAYWAASVQAKVRVSHDLITKIIDDPVSMKQLSDRKFFKWVVWPEHHILPGLIVLILMLIFGIVLVFEVSQIFNRYRANAFLHALLMTGLLAGFWCYSAFPDYFIYSMAVWLLLLSGYINAQLAIITPHRVISRPRWINVLRLTVVVPGILVLLSPLLADSVQLLLPQPIWFERCMLVWLLSILLLCSEFLFPNLPIGLKRILDFSMSCVLLTLLVCFLFYPIWDGGDSGIDKPLSINGWLIPFLFVLILMWMIGLFELFKDKPPIDLLSPSEYLLINPVVEPLNLEERQENPESLMTRVQHWLRLNIPVVVVAIVSLVFIVPAFMVLQNSGFNRHNFEAFVLVHTYLSLLVIWEMILIQRLFFHLNIQIATGFIRSGKVGLGFTLFDGHWGKRLQPDIGLTQDEKVWIQKVQSNYHTDIEDAAWRK